MDFAEPVRVELDPEQSHHARVVLRLAVGEAVELFDGQGAVARGVLASYEGKRSAWVELTLLRVHAPAALFLRIAAAAPKGARLDTMVEMLSQLGVDEWTPMLSERSVVDPRSSKVERLARAAVESAKQCERPFVMRVSQPTRFVNLLNEPADMRLIAMPRGALGDAGRLAERFRGARSALVLVGPEGGFAPGEQETARRAGFEPWCVSEQVLRVETAAVAVAALARYLAG